MTTAAYRAVILACLLFCTTAGAGILSFRYGIPLEVVFLGLGACVLGVFLLVRSPQAFLVAVIFAPQFKTSWPFSAVDRIADLTLLVLAGLLAAVVWRLLLHVSRINSLGVRHMFLGQGELVLLYLLFAATVAVSYLYTTAPAYGAEKMLRFLGIGSLLLLSPLFLICTKKDLRRFIRLFLAFSAVTVALLLTRAGSMPESTEGDITRIGAGWIMGMAVIITLFYPMFPTRRAQEVFLLCALPFFMAGVIASAARGPIVALVPVVLIRLALWVREGQRHMAVVLALGLFVSGLGGLLVLRSANTGKYVAKTREMIQLLQGNATSGSATSRLDFYVATLEAIPDDPLFGRGVGSWSVFYYGQDGRAYPHNLFLEVAFEQGLLGLGALLLLLASVGSAVMWLWRETRSQLLVVGMMVLYCVAVGMFSGDLDDNRVLWFWIGMTLAVCRLVRLQQLINMPGDPAPFTTRTALPGPYPRGMLTTFYRQVNHPSGRR